MNGRDRSRLITKMKPQVEAVRRALATDNGSRAVPVIPVLLFISLENWSLFNFRPLRFGDVFVLCGKALGKLIRADANYGSADVQELERALATALPSA